MSSYLTEATETLEYHSYDYSNKTIDLIGEEFMKKEEGNVVVTSVGGGGSHRSSMQQTTSLPSLTYTTTTIPTISSGEEAGVLYCDLHDLSRYMPENFSFDMSESMQDPGMGLEQEMLSAPTSRSMMISIPGDRGTTQSFSIQLRPSMCMPTSNGLGTFTIPTVDTTKLAGQLSVVQELPEVSRLVFQEVKQEADSIVNILENMKEEDPASMSPLDYSTAESPLNLVNSSGGGGGSKGVKRLHSTQLMDTKRLKNVLVLQGEHGEQFLHHFPVNSIHGFSHLATIKTLHDDHVDLSNNDGMGSLSYLDPPSPKSENKGKNAVLKMSYSTKTVAGTVIPSSKTCNWVFENGQICGKTFSKSYNLVVHMRMHEDIRPFACTLCDQTFRQKAHLQRHETTHGIQSKNFYRNPPGGRRRKRGSPKMSKGLQERLSNAQAFRKKQNGEDSEGEMLEDEEDDIYVPNGTTVKRIPGGRNYSSPDCEGEDREADSDTAMYDGGQMEELDGMSAQLHPPRRNYLCETKEKLQAEDSEMMSALNLAAQRPEDDDTSTVQDILHTVNSVPTLEQKLESSYLNCESLNLKSRQQTISRLVDTGSITALSLSNNNLPVSLTTTLSQHLPGSSHAQTNILYTTLAGATTSSKILSLMENSENRNQLVIENLDEHSPEIQAELLNALLADESYQQEEEEEGDEEEEVYRLNTLPSSWWVSRRRRHGSNLVEVTYYSPQGLSFRTRSEIQGFLQHNLVPRETKMAGLRHPPLPIESIPVIDDDFPSLQNNPSLRSNPSIHQAIDANSIAQVLIANLKPEPIERLQDTMHEINRSSVMEFSSAGGHQTLAAS